jgi:WD40 repeat protein
MIVSYGEPFTHEGNVLQASFSPGGQFVVTASDDGTAGIWKVPPEITWGSPMAQKIQGADPISTIGEALTATISGFYTVTNSGRIQQLGINQRRTFSTNVDDYDFADDHWRSLYGWWRVNSQQASTTNRAPWP